jgi:ADP-ribosyl-[dinitrogen reductase] hydrolase
MINLSSLFAFFRRVQGPLAISAVLAVAGVVVQKYFRRRLTRKRIDSCLGLILATAVGDAKGIPYENQTCEQIRERLARNEENDKQLYAKCYGHPFIPDDFQPGNWTDDTQLTIAMMIALAEANDAEPGSIEMNLIVREHIREWQASTVGWGGTKTAIERLHKREKGYRNSGNRAFGNGVLMKLAPLAFYFSLQSRKDEQIRREIIEAIARMTHDTPVAVITAILQCTFFENIYRKGESLINSKSKRLSVLDSLLQQAHILESIYFETEHEEKEFITTRLAKMKKYAQQSADGALTEAQLIEVSNGGTFFCVDSCTMVIGLLLSFGLSFDTILKAVYIGGDTDSNAAMVGAVVGGVKGVDVIPQEYLQNLDQRQRLGDVGIRFANSMMKLDDCIYIKLRLR